MRINILFSLFLLLLTTQCKKENVQETCLNENQSNELLVQLQPFSNDSIQISAAERNFINEIRTIANDIDVLSNQVDTSISIQQTYEQIRTNFLQHVNLVEQKASAHYHGASDKIVMAKNAFVLMSYDALQRKYPEFMWTQLGIFAANEVRYGLSLALLLRQTLIKNNIIIPFNNETVDATLLATAQVLIQGQINVLTDIGSLGILNRILGAKNIKNEQWLTPEAREGFRLQELAEQALKTGNCASYMDLQTQAAIQFGAHEQVYILQPMWNQPVMQTFANLHQLVIQLTQHKLVFFGDIFVGTNKNLESHKGYVIKIPKGISDLSNAQQRVNVAINGFNQLNELRKTKAGSYWIDYSQIKIGYFYEVYNVVWTM